MRDDLAVAGVARSVTLQEVEVVTVVPGWNEDPGALEPDGPDAGHALCAAFIDALPVTGASISVVTASGNHSVVGASDALAVELEAWQFGSGAGPHWEALRTQRPAFLYDTAAASRRSAWPPAVDPAPDGAGALFAFPLHLGSAVVGVADLYSRTAVDAWASETIRLARRVALRVTTAAVRLATRSADAAASTTGTRAVELRREVHQATGVVMSQLDCSSDDALLRLRAQSFLTGVPLEALAREVVTRRIDFALL